MGQRQKQNETRHTERQAVLSGLNAKIEDLDVAIASLMGEQHSLKRAREYVLSTNNTVTGVSNDNTARAESAPKLLKIPTYPSPFHQARKIQSSLRQEVLICNAMDREKSSSPQGSVGLLSSDEFEASFPDHNVHGGNKDSNHIDGGDDKGVGDDVRPSVERISSSTPEIHSATSSVIAANTFSRSSTPSPEIEPGASKPLARTGQGAHWQTKRVAKRKLQENAAKAREVRKRKLAKSSAA